MTSVRLPQELEKKLEELSPLLLLAHNVRMPL